MPKRKPTISDIQFFMDFCKMNLNKDKYTDEQKALLYMGKNLNEDPLSSIKTPDLKPSPNKTSDDKKKKKAGTKTKVKKSYPITETNWDKLYSDIIKASKFLKRFKERDIKTYILTNLEIGKRLGTGMQPSMELQNRMYKLYDNPRFGLMRDKLQIALEKLRGDSKFRGNK